MVEKNRPKSVNAKIIGRPWLHFSIYSLRVIVRLTSFEAQEMDNAIVVAK